MNKEIIVQIASPERYYTKCYHDFMDCNLLNGEEKIVFLALKRFLDVKSKQGTVFPTIETIQDMTGWGNQKVVKYIKSLVKKGVVKKIRQGLSKPNIYILSDYPTMWACENVEDIAAIADNQGTIPLTPAEHIAELERMGYKVEIKEKGLASEPAKAHKQALNKQNFSKGQDTTDKMKSQVEKYSMEQIKELFDYSILITDHQDYETDLQVVFEILYETLNTEKPTVRVSCEDKPQAVVAGKLMKLTHYDIQYAIDKFHQQTAEIKNTRAYLLTILYYSREQSYLDLMNLGHTNGDF